METHFLKSAAAVFCCVTFTGTAIAQRQMERLGRGVVAVRTNSTQIYVGWRLLGNDPQDVAFNLYRSANGAAAVKVNGTPLANTTDYLDTPGSLSTTSYAYSVKPVLGGVEVTDIWAHPLSGAFTLPVNPVTRQYIPVPIQPTPDDTATVSYKVKFCWVGDLDGDGEYDFVVDRSNPDVDARQWLQAYKRDGTLLWQMNMGPNSVNHYNIEPGSSAIGIGHGDNVTVYDLDGDGKSEVIVRTSNGVVFGDGAVVTAGASDNVQFLSIVNGMTGVELAHATVPNPLLGDGPMNGHMGILYLDGQRPSVLLAAKNRDVNNAFHGTITAWDWRGGTLTQRWSWVDSGATHAPEGHQIRIADVDNDGKDEFVDIGYVLDDNGTQRFNLPEVVHGDRFHLTDIDPDRPGLETYIIQQNNQNGLATSYYDSNTGSTIRKWYAGGVVDVGRGVVADVDANNKGCEFFSTQAGVFNAKGTQIYATQPFPPEAIWWDADLSREFVATVGSTAESPAISRFNPADPANMSRIYTIYNETAPGVYQAYGGRPAFWGDILGDWREEYLCVANDNSELRIYTTKTSSTTRLYTLMHNPQYRCQATAKGYVQANYVDYYLGTGMTPPQPPPMVDAKLTWRGGTGSTTWDSSTSSWFNNGLASAFTDGDSVRFDIGGNSATTVTLGGTLQPSAVTIYSPTNFTFDGTSGSLTGSMPLMKAGAGTMKVSGNHSYTGKTTVWDGALLVSGDLQGSPVTVWGGTWGGALSAGLKGGRIGGTGRFSQPVAIQYRGAITPGEGMGAAGTTTFGGGLSAADGSTLALDLSDDPSGVTRPSDRIAVTGNLSLAGKVGLVIKPLNGALAPGIYTLLTYTGTLTGGTSNLDVTVPVGTPYTLAASSGSVRLTVPVTRAPASLLWSGSSGIWDLANSQSWLRSGTPDIFVAGDTLTLDATGAANSLITLNGGLPVAGITVSSSTDYTFGGNGSISGTGGITKSGTGTLTINTSNDFTGPTLINGGVLAISSIGDAGSPGSIGAASAAASNLVLNGGTLRLTGSQTNTNRSLTLGASGGALDVAVSGSSLQISGIVGGSGKLTKTGPGTLIFAEPNTYTGGTLISGGTIYLADGATNTGGLGSGVVTFNNGTLSMANVQASETAAWNMIVPAGFTGRVNADGRCTLSGSLTGAGDFTFYTPYVRTELTGNWSAFSGRILVVSDADGGDFRVRNTSGYPLAALDLGDDVYAYYSTTGSSLTIPVGTLAGSATSTLLGGASAGATITWQIGARNEDSTFAGVIANSTGPTAITKVGNGNLVFSGANTYSGATTISSGRLLVNGSSSSTNYTVQNGGTLGGSGSITGNVSILTGGALEVGSSSGTPLSITGNLGFGANAIVRAAAGVTYLPGTYTVLNYSGTLTGTPILSWSPPAGSSLVATFSTTTAGTITMTLAQAGRGPGPIFWTGTTDFNWDATTSNWVTGSASTTYQSGDTPSFTDIGVATSPINLVADIGAPSVIIDSTKTYTFGGTGVLTGTGTLVKSGSGTLNLSTAHSYSGGTYLNGGALALTSETASVSGGPIVFQGGTLQQYDSSASYSSATYAMQVPAGQTGMLRCDSRMDLSGTLTGSGTLNIYVPYLRFKFLGDWSAFSGSLAISTDSDGGLFRIANLSGLPLAALSMADKATTLSFLNQTHTLPIGSLSGVSGSVLSGIVPDNNTPGSYIVTWRIGNRGNDSTFSGIIQNGTSPSKSALEKVGSGRLTLAGANTYTGATTITSGTLAVTGSLAATTTTVAATGTLSGNGTISGAVTCSGTLAPGIAEGTLNLAAGLVLTSGSMLDYQLGTVSDRATVTGNLTLDGTVNISASTGFTAGTYTLITYTGTLTNNTLNIGTLPSGYSAAVNTATPGQVKLVVTSILSAYEQWGITYFSSSTSPQSQPGADPDGDGTSNQAEFRLGLDPTNANSSFKATGTRVPQGFTINWPTAPGLTFEIRRATSLDSPWSLLDTVTGVGTYTDPLPPSGRAFYRVLLLP